MTAQAGGASPFPVAAIAAQRSTLRTRMRRQRRALSPAQQRSAAIAVARQLLRLPHCKPGAHIGVYLALPGELDLQPFIEAAWARGCRLFVPHIMHARRRTMAFYRFTPDSRLRTGQWNIPHLRDVQRLRFIDSHRLDVVLVPMVAFDRSGHRLGMGAGFYDRHFARLRRAASRQRPHLIGIAYAWQEVPAIDAQAHDVHLEFIVTDRAALRAQRT